jgi:hypothetical protein
LSGIYVNVKVYEPGSKDRHEIGIEIRRMLQGDDALFAEVAEEVFDEPVDASRLEGFARK